MLLTLLQLPVLIFSLFKIYRMKTYHSCRWWKYTENKKERLIYW